MTLLLAPLVAEAVGIDADRDMIEQARERGRAPESATYDGCRSAPRICPRGSAGSASSPSPNPSTGSTGVGWPVWSEPCWSPSCRRADGRSQAAGNGSRMTSGISRLALAWYWSYVGKIEVMVRHSAGRSSAVAVRARARKVSARTCTST